MKYGEQLADLDNNTEKEAGAVEHVVDEALVEAGVGGTANFLDKILNGFHGKEWADLKKVSKFMDLWGTFVDNTDETISTF